MLRLDRQLEPARRLAGWSGPPLLLRGDEVLSQLAALSDPFAVFEGALARLEHHDAGGAEQARRARILAGDAATGGMRVSPRRASGGMAERLAPEHWRGSSVRHPHTATPPSTLAQRKLQPSTPHVTVSSVTKPDVLQAVEAMAAFAEVRTDEGPLAPPIVAETVETLLAVSAGSDRTETAHTFERDLTDVARTYATDTTEVTRTYATNGTDVIRTFQTDGSEVTRSVDTDRTEITQTISTEDRPQSAPRRVRPPAGTGRLSGIRRLAALATERIDEPQADVEPVQPVKPEYHLDEQLERLLRLEARANGIDLQGDVR
jgi:hypothetical protein